MRCILPMEAMAATGMRVECPEDVAGTLDWATRTSNERSVPVLVEILTEMKENAAMGRRSRR
jgi:glyoxylate carboligase